MKIRVGLVSSAGANNIVDEDAWNKTEALICTCIHALAIVSEIS